MKIKSLKIHTPNLSNQIDFYSNTIGLKLIKKSEVKVLFQVGKSTLQLVKSEKFQPYHFAINIPCNQESEALAWLKKRVVILKDGQHEIQHFDFWNAKAIYFYDADKNIVEFIARKNLKNERPEKFSTNALLEISEIGMPVSDIQSTFNTLNQISNLEKYDGNFERFCAIGNENGLFICINKQVKDWFPTGDQAHSSDFEIKFEQNNKEYGLEFVNEEIRAIANTV